MFYSIIIIYVGRSTTNDTVGGILTLGSSDHQLFEGDLHYVNLEPNDAWWRIQMDG